MPCSEEVESTRLGRVEEEEASGTSLEIGGLGRADVDAKGGGEGLTDDGNGVGGDSRLIQAFGIAEREYRLENNDVNVVESIHDKDGSAPQCGVQAGLTNESFVLDPDQDEGRRSLPYNADEKGVEKRDLNFKYASRESARVSSKTALRGWASREMSSLNLRYTSIPLGFTQTSGLERATRRGLEGKPYG